MALLLIAALLLVGGCSSLPQAEAPDTLPKLVYQTPLPPWPTVLPNRQISVDVKFLVAADGSVHRAELLTRTGFKTWDKEAVDELLKWRFSPATVDGKPISLWIRQTVYMRFEEPLKMTLSEIVCPNRVLADSVYQMLSAGTAFDTLAKDFSTAASRASGGSLGSLNIRTFPINIQDELTKLREGEFTRPLSLGNDFVIYKRLKPAS
jgi:TonB family protein